MLFESARTDDAKGVDVHGARHAAVGQQLGRHVGYCPKCLRADVRLIVVHQPAQPKVGQSAGTRDASESSHNTTQHNTTQHNTTQHNTTQHKPTQRNAVQNKQHNTTIACKCVFCDPVNL